MISSLVLLFEKCYLAFVKSLNRRCLKHYFAKKNVECDISKTTFWGDYPHFSIEDGSVVQIGDDLIICSGKKKGIDGSQSRINVATGGVLHIGHHVGLSNVSLICRKQIFIGDYVNVGAGCLIMDSNFHSLDWRDRLDRTTDIKKSLRKPVYIGDAVFIGARCIICKGVSIGEHSIIAAGSVVVCNVPANEVWGGNPARFIKKLD